jgi:hypothetical protein
MVGGKCRYGQMERIAWGLRIIQRHTAPGLHDRQWVKQIAKEPYPWWQPDVVAIPFRMSRPGGFYTVGRRWAGHGSANSKIRPSMEISLTIDL